MSRILAKNKQVAIISHCVVDAMKSAMSLFVVAGLAIYVVSIFVLIVIDPLRFSAYSTDVAQIEDLEFNQNFNPYVYFGGMTATMFTLFSISILAEFSEIVRPLAHKQPSLAMCFILFSITITFGVLQLVVGLVLERVLEKARAELLLEKDRGIAKKLAVLDEIQLIVASMDSDNDGLVSFAEIEHNMNEKDSQLSKLLHTAELHLPIGFSAAELLCMLDNDGDGAVAHEEFVENFYRLLDSGPFQQLCVLQTCVNSLKREVVNCHVTLDDKLTELDHTLLRTLQPLPAIASARDDLADKACSKATIRELCLPDDICSKMRSLSRSLDAFAENLEKHLHAQRLEGYMHFADVDYVDTSNLPHPTVCQSCERIFTDKAGHGVDAKSLSSEVVHLDELEQMQRQNVYFGEHLRHSDACAGASGLELASASRQSVSTVSIKL